ncbi:MAG: thioredoxin family protein [Candidatus Heimdallarchaeaceae archaeon]
MSEKKLMQVIGKGCSKCEKQFEIAQKAVEETGKTDEYVVEHFTEVTKFADLDVFMTPALRINGKVVSEGRILSIEKIKELL